MNAFLHRLPLVVVSITALAVPLAHTTAAVHHARVFHEICREHGTLHEVSVSSTAAATPRLRAAATDAGHRDDCPFVLAAAAARPTVSPAMHAVPRIVDVVVPAPDEPIPAREPCYRLAPKVSPPAA